MKDSDLHIPPPIDKEGHLIKVKQQINKLT